VRLTAAGLGNTGLVAAREVHERIRTRLFRVVTLVLLAVVAGAIAIPALTHGTTRAQRVGVTGSLAPTEQSAVRGAAARVGVTVDFVPEADRSAAVVALRAGRVDLVVVDGTSVLVAKPLRATDTSGTANLVRATADLLGVLRAFADAGLTPAQAAAVSGAHPVPVTSVQSGPTHANPQQAASIVGLVVVFIMLSQYNAWTTMGVMEEKSSRVVEVLLAAVRPLQLLSGKVLGIGLVALAQAGLVVVVALGVADAVGSSLLTGSGPLLLLATLLWLVLGYAFYSWLYAAAGSMVERQDQVQALLLPLSIPVIFAYVTTLTSVSGGQASGLTTVLAYVPFSAPFAMPALVGLGAVQWWAFVLSAVISVGATVVVARGAAVVYRRAVLRTGGRVRLRELFASHSG
jgi:ABC-2 type transport system permease protein